MIRRSRAFPSRARNKAAVGRGQKRGSRRRPLGPRLPVRGPGTAAMGAGSLRSSDAERLRRAPGHPPGQVQPRRRQAGQGHLPPPPCPAGSDRSEPAASARSRASGAAALRPETEQQAPSLQGDRCAFSVRGGEGTHSPGFPGVGWGLSGEAAQPQGELKYPRPGGPAKEASRCRAGCPESQPGVPPPSGLQAKKRSSSPGRAFCKAPSCRAQQVPCCVWPACRAQSLAPRGLTVSADLPQLAPGSSASSLPMQAAPRVHGAVTRTELLDQLGSGCSATGPPPAGEGRATRRRAHPAGRTARSAELGARRLQHHGQVARARRAGRPAASPWGVMPVSPAPSSSWRVRRPPADRSRDAAASLHLAPGWPRERAALVPRKCCTH